MSKQDLKDTLPSCYVSSESCTGHVFHLPMCLLSKSGFLTIYNSIVFQLKTQRLQKQANTATLSHTWQLNSWDGFFSSFSSSRLGSLILNSSIARFTCRGLMQWCWKNWDMERILTISIINSHLPGLEPTKVVPISNNLGCQNIPAIPSIASYRKNSCISHTRR